MLCVLTPIHERREYLPILIHQFYRQDYPLKDMILILFDDSENPIGASYFDDLKNIKYIYESTRQSIHSKRQKLKDIAIEEFNADYCVCMDDDDIYHPSYISNIVNALKNGNDIVSCKQLYFFHLGCIYKKTFTHERNYACHGALGFNKEYGKNNNYDLNECKNQNEICFFTNGFKNKVKHINSSKCILIYCHFDNTVCKKRFLTRKHRVNKAKETELLSEFIGEDLVMSAFYFP